MSRKSGLAGLLLACTIGPAPVAAHDFTDDSKVTLLFQRELAGLPGKVGTMITVAYPPGGRTDRHRHPGAHVFVYVLEGEIEMGVEGGEVVRLGPGQAFYESPTDVHLVSRNASDSAPARFLVVFVQDSGQPPLVAAP